jgi:Uma2 family endonuclease
VSANPKTFLTPEQYLEIEDHAEYKSEYYNGEMFAMAGAGRAHNLLVARLVSELDHQLRKGPCEVYPSDMRVRMDATGLYTYPDVVVVCGEPQFLTGKETTLLNPKLIAEVLSDSTEAYDRGRKFEHYQSLDSLDSYILVASDRMHVDLYTRTGGNQWTLQSAGRPEETLELPSIGCRIALADLYEKVTLNPDAPLHSVSGDSRD